MIRLGECQKKGENADWTVQEGENRQGRRVTDKMTQQSNKNTK